MRVIVWVALTLLAVLIEAELIAWCRPLQLALIRRAAAPLPKPYSDRYREEWYREFEELPDGPLTRLCWVLHLVLRRGSVARALGASRAVVGFTGTLKRLGDIVLVASGLLIISPLMLAIAAVIKLQDGGPVIFRQVRIGRDGQPFPMLKFRSMVLDSEARKLELFSSNDGKGPLFKLSHDPRITPIGRFLRAFSLDELPQLFNVLAGSMSLVGPRPHLAHEIAQMPSEASRRSLVKPGLTGLWQVSGRSDLKDVDAIRLDLRYVDHWSLTLDLKIMWKTAFAVLAAPDHLSRDQRHH
jgi:lipopolysaccharide/colanic/teichoic acid biosynthesis glycosyltransferase